MKYFFAIIMMFAAFIPQAKANDGMYFTSGNFLVPTKETDISVQKEILTIIIGKDSLAMIDVYYEFMNNGEAKTVTMAFEASSSYNALEPLQRSGVHPDIKDFTVTMNDQPLPYSNRIIALPFTNGKSWADYTPLDMTKWKGWGEVADSLLPMDGAIYNAELDSVVQFAYGYFFTAPFKAGLNIIHHTYSFKMSYHVTAKFEIPYWLTPATRWANHQVDDFTLRIKCQGPSRDFCMADSVFADAPFRIVGDFGRFWQMKVKSGEHYLFGAIDSGTLEWHKTNFCPKNDMCIESAEFLTETHCNAADVVIDKDGNESRYIGDCGDSYFVSAQDYGTIPKTGCKVVEYSVDNGHGLVFPRELGTYNVRKLPSIHASIIGKMKSVEGELPDVYPCLGHVQSKDGKNYHWWYKIQFGNRIGYVYGDYMDWDSINTF